MHPTIQKLLEEGNKPTIRTSKHLNSSVNIGKIGVFVGFSGISLIEPQGMHESIFEFDPRIPVSNTVYWKAVKAGVFNLLPEKYGNVSDVLWKNVKHYRGSQEAKNWHEVLPKDIVDWAWGELEAECKGLDCVDNTRVARLSNSPQLRRYQKQKGRGCCGFRDFKRTGPDGEVYLIGFNYGH